MTEPRRIPFPAILLKPDRLTWRQAAERRRSRPDLKEQQDRSGHGNRATYTYWFCRCPKCTHANMLYTKQTRMIGKRNG